MPDEITLIFTLSVRFTPNGESEAKLRERVHTALGYASDAIVEDSDGPEELLSLELLDAGQ